MGVKTPMKIRGYGHIIGNTITPNAAVLLYELFQEGYTTKRDFVIKYNIDEKSAYRAILRLRKLGFVHQFRQTLYDKNTRRPTRIALLKPTDEGRILGKAMATCINELIKMEV